MKPITGLNDYEKAYFKRFFGTNVTRLQQFRKKLSDQQKNGRDRGCGRVNKMWMLENGRSQVIYLNRRKVDAYLELIEKGEIK